MLSISDEEDYVASSVIVFKYNFRYLYVQIRSFYSVEVRQLVGVQIEYELQ